MDAVAGVGLGIASKIFKVNKDKKLSLMEEKENERTDDRDPE